MFMRKLINLRQSILKIDNSVTLNLKESQSSDSMVCAFESVTKWFINVILDIQNFHSFGIFLCFQSSHNFGKTHFCLRSLLFLECFGDFKSPKEYALCLLFFLVMNASCTLTSCKVQLVVQDFTSLTISQKKEKTNFNCQKMGSNQCIESPLDLQADALSAGPRNHCSPNSFFMLLLRFLLLWLYCWGCCIPAPAFYNNSFLVICGSCFGWRLEKTCFRFELEFEIFLRGFFGFTVTGFCQYFGSGFRFFW